LESREEPNDGLFSFPFSSQYVQSYLKKINITSKLIHVKDKVQYRLLSFIIQLCLVLFSTFNKSVCMMILEFSLESDEPFLLL